MGRIKPQALLLQSKRKKIPSRVSLATIITFCLVIILILLSLYGTYKHWYQRSVDHLEADLHNVGRLGRLRESVEGNHPSYAILDTSKGSITMEIYKDASPDVVVKFVDLCRKGYFKGMQFHHVIKNYVIQGGEVQSLGAAEGWTLKRTAQSQLAISPKHEAFMFGTAKTKVDGRGFELFITTAPIPDLNDKLIVFGRVIKGEEIVQEIEEVDTDEHYRPKAPIGIKNILLKHEL